MLHNIYFTCLWKFIIVELIFVIMIIGKDAQNLSTLDLVQNAELGKIDIFGVLADIFDNLGKNAVSRNFLASESPCSITLIKLGNLQLQVGKRPRGYCSYCCTMAHLKKHVRLYFTNKRIGENLIEIKRFTVVGTLKEVGISSDIPTVMYIHGFTEYALGPYCTKIRNAYLSRPEDRNIIIVDWGDLCTFPWYAQAAQNTHVVGKILSEFISFYNDSGELPISQLHLVGFSLGAHVAGFIGKKLSDKQKVPRITGLDPARPLFTKQDPNQQLTKQDAEYVDVIHTDGGNFGMSLSIGHADFYPNGGTYMQPGCSPSHLAENQEVQFLGTCSHFRAVDLYAESLKNPKAFQVYKCTSSLKICKKYKSAYMGFYANKRNAVGNLYLTTNARSPFGKSAKSYNTTSPLNK